VKTVTRGVTALPPEKKSHPDIYEGGSTRNDEGYIDRIARSIAERLKGGGRELLGHTCHFLFHAWMT
jgi:hypothetical protein